MATVHLYLLWWVTGTCQSCRLVICSADYTYFKVHIHLVSHLYGTHCDLSLKHIQQLGVHGLLPLKLNTSMVLAKYTHWYTLACTLHSFRGAYLSCCTLHIDSQPVGCAVEELMVGVAFEWLLPRVTVNCVGKWMGGRVCYYLKAARFLLPLSAASTTACHTHTECLYSK